MIEDARLFKKYSFEECEDFDVFLANHGDEFPSREGGSAHAFKVWKWARWDVARRAKQNNVENPLNPQATLKTTNLTAAYKAMVASGATRKLDSAERKLAAVEEIGHAKPLPTREERESLWRSLEASSEQRGVFTPEQVTTTLTVSQDAPVGICIPSDFHVGGTIRYDLLRRDMELIRDTEGLYAIALGDYTDNFKAGSKAGNGLYGAVFADPQLQFAHITDMLDLARGKWLAICEGNHDAWDYIAAGIRRLPDLARYLDAPFFGEGGGTVACNIGTQRYRIVAKHQHPGASRINTENNQRRLWDEYPSWDNADVICLGHLHYNDLHKVNRKGSPVVYLRSGTYKTVDPWAMSKGFVPEYGVPIVILDSREKKITPFRGEQFLDGVEYLKYLRDKYEREQSNGH